MKTSKHIYISSSIWVFLILGWYSLLEIYPIPDGDASVGVAMGLVFIPLPFALLATIYPAVITLANWKMIDRKSIVFGFAPSIIAMCFIIFAAVKLIF